MVKPLGDGLLENKIVYIIQIITPQIILIKKMFTMKISSRHTLAKWSTLFLSNDRTNWYSVPLSHELQGEISTIIYVVFLPKCIT